jgi:hypothetical protein
MGGRYFLLGPCRAATASKLVGAMTQALFFGSPAPVPANLKRVVLDTNWLLPSRSASARLRDVLLNGHSSSLQTPLLCNRRLRSIPVYLVFNIGGVEKGTGGPAYLEYGHLVPARNSPVVGPAKVCTLALVPAGCAATAHPGSGNVPSPP